MRYDTRYRPLDLGSAMAIDPETVLLNGAPRGSAHPRLVDTTMFYAPRSGGVKRYLSEKREWFRLNRPQVMHSIVVPGAVDGREHGGRVTVASPKLPFGRGYRWPASRKLWADRLESLSPDVIEAGDPYVPGAAALDAGQRLGIPVIGVAHSDPAALAALHFGAWAEKPVRKRLERIYKSFDLVIAPSRYIADTLAQEGVERIVLQHWGVDVDRFTPKDADPAGLRRRLGLPADRKLLVFAGRPAKEKRIDVLVEAAERLGPEYALLLVGAGDNLIAPPPNVVKLPYERNTERLAGLIASCDAFVHANEREMFGLIVLEAMACGVPVVGVAAGGVAELIDAQVGILAPEPTGAAMAEVIKALFEGDVKAMGRVARARAVDSFGWDRTFERLSGVYAQTSGVQGFVSSPGVLKPI